ncbi:MAG TPA: hypothetical protein PKH07_17115, partial [bacterium]|nr:hypothetical protein [bacterium]
AGTKSVYRFAGYRRRYATLTRADSLSASIPNAKNACFQMHTRFCRQMVSEPTTEASGEGLQLLRVSSTDGCRRDVG